MCNAPEVVDQSWMLVVASGVHIVFMVSLWITLDYIENLKQRIKELELK